jgi:uncharacterized protein involved in response to NO
MTFGFMPFFFTGFLFTAGPRWLGRPPVAAAALLPALLPQVAGWGVFALAVHGRDAWFGATLGAFGLGAVALGWTMAWHRFTRLLRASAAPDKIHARLIAGAGFVGTLCLWLAAAGIAARLATLVHAATLVALWGFVGLTFVAVLHRMIPFFSAAALPALDAWQPLWLLWLLSALMLGEAAASVLDAAFPTVAEAILAARADAELLAGMALLALALRWGLLRSLRIRLLAMLHLGLVWLGLAIVLLGVSHALESASAGTRTLGLAPLHAYTLGFLGSTLLAMVTRVSCGHGGRALVADDFVWRLFLLLQLAAVARVAGALTAVVPAGLAAWLVVAAAAAWAAVAVAWACRYGHWYGTPRPDGRRG